MNNNNFFHCLPVGGKELIWLNKIHRAPIGGAVKFGNRVGRGRGFHGRFAGAEGVVAAKGKP